MDVLLAHSFFLKNDPKQSAKMRPYAPLGTLYAASHLRENGYRVGLFDAILSKDLGEFEALLDRHRPRFVVLYEDEFHFLNKMCLNHSRATAGLMSQLARTRGCVVIASGADVTDHPEAYFQNGVQFAIVGEGERTLLELLDSLKTFRDCSQHDLQSKAQTLPGLAIPDPAFPKGVRRNLPRPPERQPDLFPFPAWDLLDIERYRQAWMSAHGYFSINMVSTRGCPFHCNWCAKPIWGQRYAMRSPANVAEEMSLVKKLVRPDHIWFADDIFGLQPKWVVEFAHEVQARDASVAFMIQSRADLMTQSAVDALARAGCTEVWLGAESGSQKILDAMEKGIAVDQIIGARNRLRDAGVRACFFIQFGYPGETLEDIFATIQLIRDTLPDDIGISVSTPLPGTKFYEMVKLEIGERDHWQDSDDLAMLFEGTYQTPFYRRLHKLVHRDLEARRDRDVAALAQLELEWNEFSSEEMQYRSSSPTSVHRYFSAAAAPDLSKRWN